jgi:hypothetical protein
MIPPNDYKNAGIFMTIAGVLNAFTAFVWFISLVWVCVGVMWLIPMFVAFAEIGVGVMVLTGKRVGQIKAIANVLEILATVHLGKPTVQEFLEAAE